MNDNLETPNNPNRYSLVFRVSNSGNGIRTNGVKRPSDDYYNWFREGQRKLSFHLTTVQHHIYSLRSTLRRAPRDILVPSLTLTEFLQYFDEGLNHFFRGCLLVNKKDELSFHMNFLERKLARIEKMKATKEKNKKKKKKKEERLINFMANNSIDQDKAEELRKEISNISINNPGFTNPANFNEGLNNQNSSLNSRKNLQYASHSTPYQRNSNDKNASNLVNNYNLPSTNESNLTARINALNINQDADMNELQNIENEHREKESVSDANDLVDLEDADKREE